MRYLPYLFILILAVSCNGGNQSSHVQSESAISNNENNDKRSTTNKVETISSAADESGVIINFLGHDIICGNNLGKEFERICSEDKDLQYDSEKNNLTLFGTTFHVNHSEGQSGFTLLSSVQPESTQMKKVIEGISKYYGKENCEEPYHYSWLPYTNRANVGKNYPVIHLRRVRSDDGGTVINIM